jgi:hypothetical protein
MGGQRCAPAHPSPTRPSRAVYIFHYLIGLRTLPRLFERTGLVWASLLLLLFWKKTTMVIEDDELPADDSYAGRHDGESSAERQQQQQRQRRQRLLMKKIFMRPPVSMQAILARRGTRSSPSMRLPRKQHLASFLVRYEPSPTGFVNLMVGRCSIWLAPTILCWCTICKRISTSTGTRGRAQTLPNTTRRMSHPHPLPFYAESKGRDDSI